MSQYTVFKANKKTVMHQFDTLDQLSEYAAKNRYGQGYVKLTHNGTKVETVSSLYDLNDYCTKMILGERETK